MDVVLASSLPHRAWEWWKRTARKVGTFQAQVLLTVLYCLVFCPFALAISWGNDPLAIKPGTSRGWRPRRVSEETPMELALRQS